jgi:diguanylate cyclase (GGDEF)-like protein
MSDPEQPPEPEPPDSGIATAPSLAVPYQPGAERFVLVGLSGPAAGLEFTLGSDATIIGRSRKCAIRIADDEVSRQHVRFTLVPDGQNPGRALVLIEDLGSHNGMQVNGQIVDRAVLDGGEKILVGRSVLRVDRRDEIDVAHDAQLRAQALRDPLTELGNRQALRGAIERVEASRRSEARRYGVLVIDLDHFKQVNDQFGHAAGDAALRHAAHTISDVLRTSDNAFRMGGEEFVVIVPGADLSEAHAVGERIRAAIEAAPVVYEEKSIPLTASVGVAEGGEQAIERADQALYDAKHAGRNRVCDAGPRG